MKTRTLCSIGLSALMLAGTLGGCTAAKGDVAANAPAARGNAAKLAAKAGKALDRGDAVGAVALAESAVAASPQNAAYRALLGQAYLRGGRFVSARQALGESLQGNPDNGQAALNLALAETATGDWGAARRTLDGYAQVIPAGDLGLAMALSGNPQGAVTILTQAARSPGATVKTRQNLALALALAGQWQAAKMVAAADISPAEVDKRLVEWAAFAQPTSAADQVASLLGVQPVEDAGQPAALALNPVAPTADPVAVAAVDPMPSPPVELAAATPDPVPVSEPGFVKAAADPAPAPTVRLIRAPSGAMRVALAKPAAPVAAKAPAKWTPAAGDWYVQLGAYENAGVARDAWGRATKRFAAFAEQSPRGMTFASRAGSVYRLSVGGFTRDAAAGACRMYRAKGGACFIRKEAGDRTAAWVRRGGVEVAAR
ncbi:hypothetical protein ASE75_11105 [Sphingomonas sp. Leaf17]|uniref:SPOR domain-containing protein n=1 Tax=Sphingomonas sp. Leaf17 TaxID=1735683 RepID=UPI0006F56231|nr:SPOR domain-containing protein [Sphingomonas sp. Leaf17]KQM63652.1 hypothetical protein ASE75_11105 [Sphingomonas sp. Leaf17]